MIAVNDARLSYAYPIRVQFAISEGGRSSYEGAAAFLNTANVDVVCLQHEYEIFGGRSGSHVLRLLQRLEMPVVIFTKKYACQHCPWELIDDYSFRACTANRSGAGPMK